MINDFLVIRRKKKEFVSFFFLYPCINAYKSKLIMIRQMNIVRIQQNLSLFLQFDSVLINYNYILLANWDCC